MVQVSIEISSSEVFLLLCLKTQQTKWKVILCLANKKQTKKKTHFRVAVIFPRTWDLLKLLEFSFFFFL